MKFTRALAFWLVLLAFSALGLYSYFSRGAPAPSTATGSATFRPIGEPRHLPEIVFADADGRAVRLSDYRGKVMLLNVWATWCQPCREEMPSLDRLQARLGGPDFEVVALSIDRDGLPAVKEFYLQFGIKRLRIYLDESGQAASKLGVIAIPTTLLIDPQNREVARKFGAAEWDSPEMIAAIRSHLSASGTHLSQRR